MTEVVKEDIIEDYAKMFCRRHRDRTFNSQCDDCCDSYQVLLEFRRDVLYEAAEIQETRSYDCECPQDLKDIGDGYD